MPFCKTRTNFQIPAASDGLMGACILHVARVLSMDDVLQPPENLFGAFSGCLQVQLKNHPHPPAHILRYLHMIFYGDVATTGYPIQSNEYHL